MINGIRLNKFVVGFAFAALMSCGSAELFAGGGPENVVLVVNADSASSKLLANHYIQLRKIPARNVIYLNDIPDNEVASWKHCKSRIFEPLIKEIDRRKLGGSIDYIVYSADFPTAIEVTEHQKDALARLKEAGLEVDVRIFNANASLTSLTYFMGATINDQSGYMLMDANTYYRNRVQVLLRQPFIGDQQTEFEEAIKAIQSESNDELESAIKTLTGLGKKNPQQMAIHYWLAKFRAKQGDAKNATAWLTRAIRLGWCYQSQTRSDLAFAKVKDDPIFQGIVDRIPDRPYEYLPTHGFKNRYAWGPNGMVNSEPGQGNRFFLSTILGVTRGDGISEKETLENLKSSVAADESKPTGTFYFTETADVRTTTRQEHFKQTIEELKSLGFNAEIVKDKLPVKARDVIGLTCGTPTFNWVGSGSKIVPGALCDNLTSHGGRFKTPGQTKCTEFLAHGAGGAFGTVVEPYTVQAKFPHPRIHAHYARGCSMAEAFYQSVHGPFQTIVVGDALCQPWATKPVLSVTGITAGETVKGKLQLKLDAAGSPTTISGIEFFVDGLMVYRTAFKDTISFDTTGMADGYHEIRFVAFASNEIESTGHVIFPIKIENRGETTTLTSEHEDYLITDEITLHAKTNFGDSIELMQSDRALAKKIGREAEFKISADLLGRGPVKLTAVSISETGGVVASMPIELTIDGPLLDRPRGANQKPE